MLGKGLGGLYKSPAMEDRGLQRLTGEREILAKIGLKMNTRTRMKTREREGFMQMICHLIEAINAIRIQLKRPKISVH